MVGIGSPDMWPARVSAAASGVAVKVALQITPFAWRARWRAGMRPKRASILPSPSLWVVAMRPAYVLRLALRLPQLDAADLPGERLRQLVGELDPPRIGVGAEPVADEASFSRASSASG